MGEGVAYLAWEQNLVVLDRGFVAAIAVILLVVTALVMLLYNQLVGAALVRRRVPVGRERDRAHAGAVDRQPPSPGGWGGNGGGGAER